MNECSTEAFAKINLCLDVTKKRPDGYHEVRMIMQQLSLSDRVTVQKTDEPGIRLRCSDPGLPTDSRNLMVRAAERFFAYCDIQGGISMCLEKNIPLAAGLAGGSADAASVLVLLNRLFDCGLSDPELQKIGLSVGADVPYCIMGGTALAERIGEKLMKLPSCPPCGILLVKPERGASTKEIYTAWDALPVPFHPDVDLGIKALKDQDLRTLAGTLGNGLEAVTKALIPEIGEIEEQMLRFGALGACMSGSGPTVFGLFKDRSSADLAGEKMKGYFPDCRIISAEPINNDE